jgi:hypothetical protein
MSNEIATWALQKRFDEIGINFRATWDLFLKMTTIALTANVALMAYFLSQQINSMSLGSRLIITTSMVTLNVLTTIQCANVAWYHRQVTDDLRETADSLTSLALNQGETIDPAKCFKTSLPLKVGWYGAWMGVAAFSIFALIWLTLLFLTRPVG